MKYVTWLWLNMRGIRWNTAMRVIIGIGQVGLGLMMVWLSRVFIDKTIRSGSAEDVMQMVLWLVITVVGGVVLRQVYYYMTTTANVRQTNMLRLRIFSRLFHRQLFGDKTMHSGDITSRLAKDIDTVSSVTTDSIPQMSVTMIQLCGAFLMMRWFDARLAWALLILTPVAIIFGKLIARKLRKMTLDIRQDESKIQMQVQETMEHNAVLRSLGSEQWVTERLDTMQQRLQGNVMRRTRFTVITRLIMGCVFGLGYLMAFVWGGIGLRNGTITFGVMTSFLQLVGMIQHPILQMLNMVPGIIHATASIDRLEELDQTEQEFTTEGRTPEIEVPGIRFNNTSFHYADGDRLVVDHFSHDFKAGSKTAIMGETGIGKTTLFRLLLGFIKPTEGSITLYTLLAVLHTACADFINDLPQGLSTELGERGKGLSEGQAQRIAIARGLLCPGNILLLDEISSSLDGPTEQELYKRLFTNCKEKTMLFITHRKTVSELCDEVIRL